MKLKLLIAFALLAGIVSAQTNLVSYEYWFNNDYANVQTVIIAASMQIHVLNTNLDVSALHKITQTCCISGMKTKMGSMAVLERQVVYEITVQKIPGT